MSAIFLLWVPGWEIPCFLPGTPVSSQKSSTRFLFNLDLSMGFSFPNGAIQPFPLNVCSGLTASGNFIKVLSRFHSVTSVTGWKGTVSVRWEKLFQTECLYPGKIQPLFLFCARPPERQEREECVQHQCWKFVSLCPTRDFVWMNRSTFLAGKDYIKKKSSKTNISASAFWFQWIFFWQMLF